MTTGNDSSWYRGNAWAGGPKPRTLLGVAYDFVHAGGLTRTPCGYVIVAADHRFFAGRGLANGDVIGTEGRWGGACGWEVDTAIDFGEGNGPPPPDLQILAHGQNVARATQSPPKRSAGSRVSRSFMSRRLT